MSTTIWRKSEIRRDTELQKKKLVHFVPRHLTSQTSLQNMRTLEIRRVVDEGSFSTIFEVATLPQGGNLVEELQHRKLYAVKTLKLVDHLPFPEAAARSLALEARIVSDLDHDNIIRLHDTGTSHVTPFNVPFLVLDLLVMTLDQKIMQWKQDIEKSFVRQPSAIRRLVGSMCSGNHGSMGTLDSSRSDESHPASQGTSSTGNERPRLRSVSSFSSISEMSVEDSPRPSGHSMLLDRLKVAALGIARGVEYLHDRKHILHRDLKPPNIGFDANGQVKIFDFNLSRRFNPGHGSVHHRLTEAVGTQRYMAPEVSRLECCTPASDVYSFAIITYEICSLKRPFNYPTVGSIKRRALSGERPSLKHVQSESLRSMLSLAWAPSRHARPTMHTIRKRLENDLVDHPKLSLIHKKTHHRRREWSSVTLTQA